MMLSTLWNGPTGTNNPYLSIVVVARNDNYGGDFTNRISTFARSLGRQARRFPGLFELIVVEWNPPADRERLENALAWPPDLNLRIITVPKEIHERIASGSRMPLLEFFGKNVGIRRARGEFVLVTNADIILTDELINELAKRQLQQGAYYRTDRYDYDGSGIEHVPTENLIDFAASRVNFVHLRHGRGGRTPISIRIPPGSDMAKWPKSPVLWRDKVSPCGTIVECRNEKTPMWGLHTNASGDFLLASRNDWTESRGFWERLDTFTHLDSYAVCRMRSIGLLQVY
jgi:hypothetical protein